MEVGHQNVTESPFGSDTAPLNLIGLLLIPIPLVTIAGNVLVILSVLRFRALQSAINFLILGLAVADLLVAIFVMPYAVYVHVYRGMWQLGNLMCDIYMASDVACSTASILLLAVISFDRYRAVSRPIQYSRQSQNVRRVWCMIGVIWIISMAVASPMVFGVNVRPADADERECRFYNAEFSIGSSFISFVIPCFLVLFVYIRIILALKKREKAAKLRRQKNLGLSANPPSSEECDEAGRIVAGPVVNVMMMALPSMASRMRRFERHREAIELAGDDDLEIDLGPGEAEPPAAALLRRVLQHQPAAELIDRHAARMRCECDAVAERSRSGRVAAALPSSTTEASTTRTSTSPSYKEREFGGRTSSTPRSSMDSLSDNAHIITNDFISEKETQFSRKSSGTDEGSQPTSSGEKSLSSQYKSSRRVQKSKLESGNHARSASFSLRSDSDAIIPSLIRNISRRSPRIFRRNADNKKHAEEAMILKNPTVQEDCDEEMKVIHRNSQTETETISPTRMDTNSFSRSTTINSDLLGSPEGNEESITIFENPSPAPSATPLPMMDCSVEEKENPPTVTFALTVRNMAGSPSNDERLKGGSFDNPDKSSNPAEPALAMRIMTKGSVASADPLRNPLSRMDSGASSIGKERKESYASSESRNNSKKQKNGGIAVKLVKRTLKHEQSLKRKVSKAQRKEKRATKTLGVVVGVFLICWVPFFAINIVNAVCVLAEKEFCQVSFDLFFYCTWIGYMNSFMNPIIYTIFNTEFRRAFKSLLCGRKHNRAFTLSKQVNV